MYLDETRIIRSDETESVRHPPSIGSLPSRPDQVLRLDLTGPNLSIFGTLLDIGDQLLLLVLQLDSFAIELTLRPVQSSLVFAQTLCGRHTLSESPLDDLRGLSVGQ